MTDQSQITVEEGNRLIADFVGMTQQSPDFWVDKATGESLILGQYRPDTDWNELMGAVEKIESSADQVTGHIRVEIGENFCTIYQHEFKRLVHTFDSKKKIKAVFEAVVLFIQWYNSQK